MKYIKEYNQFVVNEEDGFFRNLLFSTLFALGINQADAQTIQQDSLKTEIVKDISNFNKSIIYNLHTDKEIPLNNLRVNLSKNLNEPEIFIDRYLKFQPDGTLVVKPEFIKGLELHLNRRQIGFSYEF